MGRRWNHVRAGRVGRRRLRLYGVGNGRSGTTSLARMFGSYCTGHEVDRERMRSVGAQVLTGRLDGNAATVRALLRARSVGFRLEVDVAGNLTPFAAPLARMYPSARFVLLVRDCFSWLDSRLDLQLRKPTDGPGDVFFEAQYMRYPDSFTPGEGVLADAGLRPIASYLRAWADMTNLVLASVPATPLLVVRTEDLSGSVETLARFAGVPASTLQAVHTNVNPSPSGLLGQVPASTIVEQARRHCGSLMERYWGLDWVELAERIPH